MPDSISLSNANNIGQITKYGDWTLYAQAIFSDQQAQQPGNYISDITVSIEPGIGGFNQLILSKDNSYKQGLQNANGSYTVKLSNGHLPPNVNSVHVYFE
jgi:hypothetical protein